MEHTDLRDLFIHHPAKPEELQQIQEIAIIGKSLAERFSLIKTEGAHSVSGDLKQVAILGIKTAIMQANAAIIVGRAINERRAEERKDTRTPQQQLRDLVTDVVQSVRHMDRVPPQPSDSQNEVGSGKAASGDQTRAVTARDIEKRVSQVHPDFIVKVRRRKSR